MGVERMLLLLVAVLCGAVALLVVVLSGRDTVPVAAPACVSQPAVTISTTTTFDVSDAFDPNGYGRDNP